VDAEYNTCSPYLDDSPERFYNYCPNIVEDKCGAPLVSMATNSYQTVTVQNISFATNDTCYYIVKNEAYKYQDGARVFIEFETIDSSLTVYVRASSGIDNETDASISELSGYTPSTGQEYSINQGDSFIVTVVPGLASVNETISFRYITDGMENDSLTQIYYDLFVTSEDKDLYTIIFIVALALIVICPIVCIGYCIKRNSKKKKNQIHSQSQYNEMAQNTKNKLTTMENGLSATEGANNDLELESIHGSNDGDATGQGDTKQNMLK